MLVDAFDKWVIKNKEAWETKGILLWGFGRSEYGSAKLEMDAADGRFLGQILVWDVGFCDVTALDCATGDQLFYDHYEPKTPDELLPVLDKYLGRMAKQ